MSKELPKLKTFKNPLSQFAYDQRLTRRQLTEFLDLSLAQLPVLLSEDPSRLKHTRLVTLKRIKDLSEVDLITWYLNETPVEEYVDQSV